MADSLLGQLGALATPEVLGQVSKMTGVDTSLLNKGLGAAGATALGSMANSAGSADGLSGLMDMVNKAGSTTSSSSAGGADAISGIMGNILGSGGGNAALGGLLGSVLGGGGGGAAGAMTNSIMGGGINAISGTLSKSLGFNVAPLLTMAVPALLATVTKAVKGGNLDAYGLKSMLTDQSAAFMTDPANADMAKLVGSALDAGKVSVENQAKYTSAGAAAIKAAPLAAVAMVTAASPSKGDGVASEFAAAAGAISQAAGKSDPTSLLNGIFGGGVSEEDMQGAVDRLGSADPTAVIKAGIDQVSQGNPGEVAAYKSMILGAATSAAEAAKEGGFLGIGGEQVSPAEQAVLDNLRKLLA